MTDMTKASPTREDVTPGDRFRHVKRGSEYEVVGVAQLQTTDPVFDDSVMVVYRGDHGQLWTREVHEFLDRRFERLANTARPDAEATVFDSGNWKDVALRRLKRTEARAVPSARSDAGDEDVERVARALLRNKVGDGEKGVSITWGGNPEIKADQAIAAISEALAAMREGVGREMVERVKAAYLEGLNEGYGGSNEEERCWANSVSAATLSLEQPR